MGQVLIEARNLKKYYHMGRKKILKAVDDVSFTINEGEIVGIVGESGCGKTTCGRTAAGLYPKDGGMVYYRGRDIHKMHGSEKKDFCRRVQTVFQDPYASLDGKINVLDLIAEGIDIHHMAENRAQRREMVMELMEQVGLHPSDISRYPHEFSGGMRQRIGIARALAVKPEFLLCDEPISALDVSIQAQVMNLLLDLRERRGLTYLIISHDLSMMKYVADRIFVMYLGKIVESCPAEELYRNPLHPYTKALISAIPIPDPEIEQKRQRIVLHGQVPSPVNPPAGCRFAGRCPYASDICNEMEPELKEYGIGHFAACHRIVE